MVGGGGLVFAASRTTSILRARAVSCWTTLAFTGVFSLQKRAMCPGLPHLCHLRWLTSSLGLEHSWAVWPA